MNTRGSLAQKLYNNKNIFSIITLLPLLCWFLLLDYLKENSQVSIVIHEF
jgi:hypothetical protein